MLFCQKKPLTRTKETFSIKETRLNLENKRNLDSTYSVIRYQSSFFTAFDENTHNDNKENESKHETQEGSKGKKAVQWFMLNKNSKK